MRDYSIKVAPVLLLSIAVLACGEIDTKLAVRGGNPPDFVMTGNGSVRQVWVWGPKMLRKMDGPDSSAYWYITSEDGDPQDAGEMGTLKYGVVPKGYHQVYPEQGMAEPLVEGEKYLIRVSTANANGAQKSFVIRDGVVKYGDYGSNLDEK